MFLPRLFKDFMIHTNESGWFILRRLIDGKINYQLKIAPKKMLLTLAKTSKLVPTKLILMSKQKSVYCVSEQDLARLILLIAINNWPLLYFQKFLLKSLEWYATFYNSPKICGFMFTGFRTNPSETCWQKP